MSILEGFWLGKTLGDLTFEEFEEMQEEQAQRLYDMSVEELRVKTDSAYLELLNNKESK